jgi:hypothetical protein
MSPSIVRLAHVAVPVLHFAGEDAVGAVRLVPLGRALPPHRAVGSAVGLPTVAFGVGTQDGPRDGLHLVQVTALVLRYRALSPEAAELVVGRLKGLRLAHLLYSLHEGADEDEASFVVVVPLSRPLLSTEYGAAWSALQADLEGLACWEGVMPAGPLPVPWCPPAALARAAYVLCDGFPADVDALLTRRTLRDAYPGPTERRRRAQRQRARGASGGGARR